MPGYKRIFRLVPRNSRELERQLDEEVESHIEMRAEELVRHGMDYRDARAEALRRFGDREALYASARRRDSRIRRGQWLDSIIRDVVLAVRQARRAPGFTALALAIFALGIGLTTATFTVVDHVLLRPLPYPQPDRLVGLESVDSLGRQFGVVSSANWHDWRERNRTLAVTALHSAWEERFDVATGEDAFRVSGQRVVGPLFEALRVPMLVGRPFSEDEARDGEAVAVVSEGFWRRVLGGAPQLDHELVIAGRSRRIVGVVPAGLEYPRGTEVWIPATYAYRKLSGAARNNVNWLAVASLREGVELEQARADLGSIADAIRSEDPAGIYSYGVGVRPLREVVVGDAGGYLGPLMGAVALVLLIACANLAGISFARTLARSREFAVRAALGAGRARVVRQLVTEYVLFALVGGGVGLVLTWVATRLVVTGAASRVPRVEEIGIDGRILVFALAVSLLAGLLASLTPALRAARTSLREAVGSMRSAVSGGWGLTGAALVGGEIALAVVLVTGSGLLIRSFLSLLARDVGFDAHGVVAAEVALTGPRYADPSLWTDYWDEALERARTIPAVGAAGLANWIPTVTAGRGFIEVEGREAGRDGAGYRVIGGDYFQALGVPLLAGRTFDARDGPNAPRVVIVNRRMAEMYWPGEDPIGRRVKAVSMEGYIYGHGPPWLTVIGVVGDMRHHGFAAAPFQEMFVHYRQVPQRTSVMHVVARADRGSAEALANQLGRKLRDQDPTLAADVSLLEERLYGGLHEERLTMSVLTGFGLLALLLAGLGVYGLLSFAVARRTREIGVRAALGAQRAGIVGLVLGDALRLAAVGALLGLFGAFWLTKLLEALLVDVPRTDLLSYGASFLTVMCVAVVAGLVPARRAARLDPLVALRTE